MDILIKDMDILIKELNSKYKELMLLSYIYANTSIEKFLKKIDQLKKELKLSWKFAFMLGYKIHTQYKPFIVGYNYKEVIKVEESNHIDYDLVIYNLNRLIIIKNFYTTDLNIDDIISSVIFTINHLGYNIIYKEMVTEDGICRGVGALEKIED